MTVFDRLEAQLLDAHAHRGRRPLPAPRRVLAFAAAAAAIAVIVAAALSAGSSNTATPAARPGDSVPPVVPGRTGVAVLNATRSPGAAKRVAARLVDRGWKIVNVTNYTDGVLKTSCVEFTPGHSQAASTIATQLGIASLVPPAAAVQRLAGPRADVIVLVGADQAR